MLHKIVVGKIIYDSNLRLNLLPNVLTKYQFITVTQCMSLLKKREKHNIVEHIGPSKHDNHI